MEILENKKIEIIEQIGEDGIRKLKFSKLLKLIQNEIQELLNYWNIKQVHELVQDVFNIPISSPLFYRYCGKNIKKYEKTEVVVSQKVDIKKSESSVKNIDDLTDSTLDFLSKNLPRK